MAQHNIHGPYPDPVTDSYRAWCSCKKFDVDATQEIAELGVKQHVREIINVDETMTRLDRGELDPCPSISVADLVLERAGLSPFPVPLDVAFVAEDGTRLLRFFEAEDGRLDAEVAEERLTETAHQVAKAIVELWRASTLSDLLDG